MRVVGLHPTYACSGHLVGNEPAMLAGMDQVHRPCHATLQMKLAVQLQPGGRAAQPAYTSKNNTHNTVAQEHQ
jgi:hypothetical protein